VKPLAAAANGDTSSKVVDAGGGEVRLAACLKAWASAEEARLSLEANFGASLAQKEVCATPSPILEIFGFDSSTLAYVCVCGGGGGCLPLWRGLCLPLAYWRSCSRNSYVEFAMGRQHRHMNVTGEGMWVSPHGCRRLCHIF